MNAETKVKWDSRTVPDWLTAGVPDPAPNPNTARVIKTIEDMMFESLFDTMIDKVTMGKSLKSILVSDIREFDRGAFVRWMRRDPVRLARYHEALEDQAEVLASEVVDIADGDPNAPPEDVRRSDSRINARKWQAGIANRKRFGDVKQFEVNQTLSITRALAAANERVIEGTVIDIIAHGEDR